MKLLKNSNGASGAMGGSGSSDSGMQMTKKEDINYLSLFSITDPTSNSGNSANPKSVSLATKLASCIKNIITNKYWYYDGEWEKEDVKNKLKEGLEPTSKK